MPGHSSVGISRREALRLGSTGALAVLASAGLSPGAEPAKPSLHVYEEYGWLRGFSVVPSWGARIEEAWWSYDPSRFREEVALARGVHANGIRLWIEFTAWMADPDKVTERFLDAVKAIDEAGMKTMPCLFNRWHDHTWDYGGQYFEDLYRNWAPKLQYVRALVEPLVADPRVLVWDLCNEPQASHANDDWAKREVAWLTQVAGAVRDCGARQPITIGTMTGANIDTYAHLCDVLCAHPYSRSRAELEKQIAGFREQQKKHNKPMLVNECIPGCLDDRRRAAIARDYTELLSQAGFGWMGWALREGRAISTRRDRYDGNGLDGQGFHPFFTRDGRLRDGLEFLTESPQQRPPWQAETPAK